MATRTFKGEAAHARLAAFGLEMKVFLDAVSAGHYGRGMATELDPVSAAGMMGWILSVRVLREGTIKHKWAPRNLKGCPLVVSPCGEIAISVQLGTPGTGVDGADPSTKRACGPVIQHAVEQNQTCLAFIQPTPRITEGLTTWILLIQPGAKEIRSELSLPSMVNDDGYPVSWEERILLEPVPIDDDAIEIEPGMEPGPDAGEEIEIPVVRKAQ